LGRPLERVRAGEPGGSELVLRASVVVITGSSRRDAVAEVPGSVFAVATEPVASRAAE